MASHHFPISLAACDNVILMFEMRLVVLVRVLGGQLLLIIHLPTAREDKLMASVGDGARERRKRKTCTLQEKDEDCEVEGL